MRHIIRCTDLKKCRGFLTSSAQHSFVYFEVAKRPHDMLSHCTALSGRLQHVLMARQWLSDKLRWIVREVEHEVQTWQISGVASDDTRRSTVVFKALQKSATIDDLYRTKSTS